MIQDLVYTAGVQCEGRSIRRRRTLPLLALATVLILSGCAGGLRQAPPPEVAPADSVAEVRQEAALALETQRAARAKQLYQALLAERPDDPEGHAGMGEALVLLGDYQDGLEHSLRAIDLADRHELRARALHVAGLALLLTERAGDAEEKLEAAAQADPASWRVWNALGRARDARRVWDDAAAAYGRALDLAPDEAAILNNYGLSRLSAGALDEAADLFTRALRASPDLAAAETNLRLTLALQGDYDQALAGVAAGDLPDALNNAGYAALLRGDYAKSRLLLLQAIERSPSFHTAAWSNLQFLGSVESRRSASEPAL